MSRRTETVDMTKDDLKEVLMTLASAIILERESTFPQKRRIARLLAIAKRLNFKYGLLTGHEIRMD